MIINRVWAMPNKNTFQILPIRNLLQNEVNAGKWINPFCGNSDIGDIRNDLDPRIDADFHMDALEFLKGIDSADGVLFDPPYSPRQVSECYRHLDKTVNIQTTQSNYWSNLKAEISRIVVGGGKCITFGWNSGGIGRKYGFEITRILLVPHGGWHNDTIVTVERKIQSSLATVDKNKGGI